MPTKMRNKSGYMIWGLSLHAWEEVMRGSLLLAGVLGIIVGLATTFVVSLTREEVDRANASSEFLKKETARLSAEAETARKETAMAQLQLEQMRFPRRLNSEKFKNEIKEVQPQFFEVLYDQGAADGSYLAFEIFVTLLSVGWKTDQKLPAPLTPQLGPHDLRDVYQLLPLTQQFGASAWGVSVVTKGPISDDETKPENVLGKALLESVASPVQTVGGGKDETMPAGKIRIVVSPKLP
jgi:hypothetical protein